MQVILINAMADKGNGEWLFSGASTFHDYINYEQCIPRNLKNHIEETGESYSYVHSDMCIIMAQSQITLPDGSIKHFKSWNVSTFNTSISTPLIWAHRELPIYRNQENISSYVITAVYGQLSSMPLPPLPHIDLSKMIKLKRK